MKLSTYGEAAAFLDGLIDYEKLMAGPIPYDTSNFDLGHFRSMLRDLGDPHLKYAVVHVAGTKGKGSTCAFIATALRACGFKVGLYTSPHIERYTERIEIDGQPVIDQAFCALLEKVAEKSQLSMNAQTNGSGTQQPQHGFRTVFELLTAAAFIHFAEQEIDIAVVETGLGGRLDSTNVFDSPAAGPLIDVITAIGYDHTAILGDSIEQIAREKCAIIQPHALAVLAPQPCAWETHVRQAMESRLDTIGREEYLDVAALIDARESIDERPDGTSSPELSMAEFTLDPSAAPPDSLLAQTMVHGLTVRTRMQGAHQADNIRTCLGVLLALEGAEGFQEWVRTATWRRPGHVEGLERGFPAEQVRRGIAKTRWPGRFEIISRHPIEIIDGSHCPLSVAAMVSTFREIYGHQQVILVAGFLRDKDPVEICATIPGQLNVAAIVCCTPPTPRGMPAEETMLSLQSLFPTIPVEVVEDPEEAIRGVLQLRDENQAVLVFGSMYIVGITKRVCKELDTVVSDSGVRA